MSDPVPSASTGSPGDPEPSSDLSFGKSFLATFAGCVVPSVALVAFESEIIFLMPLVWGGLLLVGLGFAIVGRGKVAGGMVLGSIVGAVVGFSVCTGMMPLSRDLR